MAGQLGQVWVTCDRGWMWAGQVCQPAPDMQIADSIENRNYDNPAQQADHAQAYQGPCCRSAYFHSSGNGHVIFAILVAVLNSCAVVTLWVKCGYCMRLGYFKNTMFS